MAKITTKDVEEIAYFARLELKPDQLEKFANNLSDILTHVEQLQKLDISTEVPRKAAHVHDFDRPVLQDDKPRPSLTEDQVFVNSDSNRRNNDYFVVED